MVFGTVVQIAGSDRLDDRYQSGACVRFCWSAGAVSLYLRFNEKTEENGDKIERLLPPPAAEKKKNLNRKRKNIFSGIDLQMEGSESTIGKKFSKN